MPLRRFLTKLLESSSAKDIDACKTAIKDELANLSKSQRDTRELHAAVQQLIEVYLSKKSEFIIDIVANVQEAVANELLRQVSEKVLFARKEFANYSSGATFSASQSSKYYEMLCCLLEFLLKVVSRGPWWNQMVITATWAAFTEVIRDQSLGGDCYISVVYILSICIPYSIAALDERLMLWLCSMTTTLLNRSFSEGSVKAVAHQLVEENMKSAIMQLVLILYGIIPITFIRQLMQKCPSDVVDYVVSQLRLHPILSQHLATRQAAQAVSDLPTSAPSSTSTQASTTSPAIGGGGLSQAECKSKNRFRGKDFSDIVTECLNYEATSPPKMFSADFPATSLLGNTLAAANSSEQVLAQAVTEEDDEDEEEHVSAENGLMNRDKSNSRWSAFEFDAAKKALKSSNGPISFDKPSCQHHHHYVQRSFGPPAWCHPVENRDDAYFYSCPASPTASPPRHLDMISAELAHFSLGRPDERRLPPRPGALDSEMLQLSSDTLATTTSTLVGLGTPKGIVHRSRMKVEMKAQKSLGQVNDAIRSMLSVHRVSRDQVAPPLSPDRPQSPDASGLSSVPSQYVKCYVKLQQLKSEGLPEAELLKEQLRLAQLSLSWERHRQLVFICKNRSLMTEHKKNGELEGQLVEAKRRISELEAKLEHEIDRRNVAEQRLVHLLTQPVNNQQLAGLSVNVSGGSDFLLADLSPRYRKGPVPLPNTGTGAAAGSATSPQAESTESLVPSPATSQVAPASGTASTGMHRAQSSSEFGTSTATTNAPSNQSATIITNNNAQSSENVNAKRGDSEHGIVVELMKTRDDLQTELGVLRQQLRQLQLEAMADSPADEVPSAQTGSNGGQTDEAADRIELMTQQFNDSRREVATMGDLMAEMKTRLDVAEMDRRRLSAELTRIALYGPVGYGGAAKFGPASGIIAPAPQLAVVGATPTSASAPSHPSVQATFSNQQAPQPQQNQYPTLKKQVEKILLKKQEIAMNE